jgi:purine-cytosine permease-like protein
VFVVIAGAGDAFPAPCFGRFGLALLDFDAEESELFFLSAVVAAAGFFAGAGFVSADWALAASSNTTARAVVISRSRHLLVKKRFVNRVALLGAG